jgi:hypothetical protein
MVVVEAIRALCLKFPAKHRSLMNFLSNILREEGGFEYKKSIVNAILALIQVGVVVVVGGAGGCMRVLACVREGKGEGWGQGGGFLTVGV